MTTKEIALAACNKIADPELKQYVIDSINSRGDWVQSVKAFHRLYDCPDRTEEGLSEGLPQMSDDRLELRLNLIREEVEELEVATEKRDEIEMADALGDIIYVVVGFALEMGLDLNEVIAEIQASNMTKLGADGQVVRREDGKVLKGPNYRPPNIASVLRYRT